MGVTIPFTPQAASAGDGQTGGVLIPLRFGTGTFATATGAAGLQEREQAVLRAVAAAVALSHTAEALTVAREAQAGDDDLGARFAAVVAAEGDLRIVLDEVVRVQGDRSGAPSANEEQRVVAQAVGADPVLVAAAHAKVVGNNKTGPAAGQWVAVVDAPLLERAARSAARRELVSRPTVSSSTDIKQLEEKIDQGFKEVKDQFTALEYRLVKLEGKTK
jgi:hypothetical protein